MLKYFAYGSNLCCRRLCERVPSAIPVSVGILRQYDLRFHKRSIDGSGKCNAYYTGVADDHVVGVVFEINDRERTNLDDHEGVGRGYHCEDVTVAIEQGTLFAFTYIADEVAVDDRLRPYSWYKDLVVHGASEHGFPSEYIARLEQTAADDDSDASRDRKQRSIISACSPPGSLK